MASRAWLPSKFARFEKRLRTSMSTSLIVTDAGKAYAKCLGNNVGPHALACEWIGTRVAEILRLPTLDFAHLVLTTDDVPFDQSGHEEPGTAFVTRAEQGVPWNTTPTQLQDIENPEAIPRLVVLDTLLRNKDRCSASGLSRNPDNVFLSQERAAEGYVSLLAMDHSHAIANGRPFEKSLTHIATTKDPNIYGLFEDFIPFFQNRATRAAVNSLGNLTDSKVDDVLSELPVDWQVGPPERGFLRTFLIERRSYLVDTLYTRLSAPAGPQRTIDTGGATT